MRILPVNIYRASSPSTHEKPSFQGRTENPIKKDKNGNTYVEILDTNVSKLADGKASSLDDYIEVYKSKVYDPYHKFQKIGNGDSSLIYIADPKEEIDSSIALTHSYVVYDEEPQMPTLEQLEHKFKSRKAVLKDYSKDANFSQLYNNRLNLVAKKEIKKSENFLEEYKKETANYDSYQNCRPIDIINLFKKALNARQKIDENKELCKKTIDRQLLAHEVKVALAMSENDFSRRDKIADTIESINSNIQDTEKMLKEIEVEKYLLDERTEKIQKEIQEVNKREEAERQQWGPSYNTSYPPSQTYYHRTYLENQRRDNIEKSEKLQQEYDRYVDIKNTYLRQKEDEQDKLNTILEILSERFEAVKRIYKEYGDK